MIFTGASGGEKRKQGFDLKKIPITDHEEDFYET